MLEKLPFGSKLKTFLESKKTYRRWKHSEAGLWLWRQFASRQNEIIRQEDRFFAELLQPLRSPEHPIFDIGANVGWVSKTFLRYSKKVVAVEPDSFCHEVLKERFGKHGTFSLVPKAVSDSETVKEFLIQEDGSALNTFSDKWRAELETGFFAIPYPFSSKKVLVPTTTMEALIGEFGLPCLAKIDVEGHELEAIKGLRQAVPLLVFEANLPVFLEETQAILNTLRGISRGAVFNYAIDFQLQLKVFLPPDDFKERLVGLGKCSIDVVCRMGNYLDFYKKDYMP